MVNRIWHDNIFFQFFDVHTDFDVFRKLPDTIRRMADRLLDSDSVLQQHSTGTLNSSSPQHLKLMGELQLIQDVINTVSSNLSSPQHLKLMGELQLIQDVINTVRALVCPGLLGISSIWNDYSVLWMA